MSSGMVSGALGCSGPSSSTGRASSLAVDAPRAKIAAICFDLFTLFDPRTMSSVAADVIGERHEAFSEAWRNKQFQYAFLRAAADQYEDFEAVTRKSLEAVARAQRVELSAADRDRLVAAYSQLTPWPDAAPTLAAFRRAGLKLAPLANYAPRMLSGLLENAGLDGLFDAQISTHGARTFKPDPRAYALGPEVLGLEKSRIAFAAFGGWDAAGAAWFGFPTFWVNRLGVPREELAPGPDATGPTLAELSAFVERWA